MRKASYMTTSENRYDFWKRDSLPFVKTRYFFISEGKRPLVKIVEYDYVDLKDGRVTYNLAFSTYNRATGKLEDVEISSNGKAHSIISLIAPIVSRVSTFVV